MRASTIRRDPPRTAAPTTASAASELDGVKPPLSKQSAVGRFRLGDTLSLPLIVPATDTSTLPHLGPFPASPLRRRSSIARTMQYTARPRTRVILTCLPQRYKVQQPRSQSWDLGLIYTSSVSSGVPSLLKRAWNGDTGQYPSALCVLLARLLSLVCWSRSSPCSV